ncbi:4Fe-4S dicluster domain-containing protein [Hornefia butyriciproducens]|uniref:4Fe-4S dicluster domain-containing protein n=1 Tax=Hornefia butyriciproducens TaxID=2652293 RepID=A0A6L5Y3S3_9FIRM|nr:4Fe-4S dicluster domain-containing protein [Hornefia butyriciproducens]MDY5423275.1 4Fe-4S dicluster domain-containing protein [Hornefia butyriciproducens]MST51359.1 4Fe-4S dicluster domain-containing protein [Hornefia butyriciproducens]
MNADVNIIQIKHEVWREVARLAFEGVLEEKYEYLPEQLCPGPLPEHRCCVYREREITRQRVRTAMGKAPEENDNGNIVQVIDPACADCPISSYLVTDNCQNCVGKSCVEACRFDAVIPGKNFTEIDRYKCKECGMCARACPYNAIVHIRRPCKSACPVDALTYDEYGLAKIDTDKCIQCGQCVHNCPFAAITGKSSIVQVIEAIKSKRSVYVLLAPAMEGQYGKEITIASWRKAAKQLGFDNLFEVGLGADLTTASEAEEWKDALKTGELKTTSCCPAFVNYIRKFYPELAGAISTTVSPMCQLSRMIKAREPYAVTVFVGPCMAKKAEVQYENIPGNADYALTFNEFEAMMLAKDVHFEAREDEYQQSSIYGKRYASAGGVADACEEYLREQGFDGELRIARVSGHRELKKTLELAKLGKLDAQFIEGMFCDGGCFNGPCGYDSGPKAKRAREALLSASDERTISSNIENIDRSAFDSHR